MGRICPRCGSGLVDRQFGELTLDGCTACGGVWFDSEELSKLARDPAAEIMQVEQAFQPAVLGTEATGKMECPRCALPLYAFSFAHTPDVQLNACRQCRGVWVDDGELQKIVERVESARSRQSGGQPAETAPVGGGQTGRMQMRAVASFLITRPCPACRQNNPSSALVCWACGQGLQTAGAGSFCPRCDRVMAEFKSQSAPTHLDACMTCKGVWFGGGELAAFLRFGIVEIQDIRHRIGDGVGHFVDRRISEVQMLNCPHCSFCMERDTLGAGSPVEIDVCPTCRGIWLDAGELVRAYEYYQQGGIPGARSASDPWQ